MNLRRQTFGVHLTHRSLAARASLESVTLDQFIEHCQSLGTIFDRFSKSDPLDEDGIELLSKEVEVKLPQKEGAVEIKGTPFNLPDPFRPISIKILGNVVKCRFSISRKILTLEIEDGRAKHHISVGPRVDGRNPMKCEINIIDGIYNPRIR